MALFDLLSVNAQSLTTFQKGIDLTNKNINNVYNKDYARERPIFEELPAYGVNLAEAHRVFDQRYFDRYLKENQTLAFHQDLESNLDGLEAIFNDINGTGFAKDINDYFSKINRLVSEPDNMAARQDFLVTARKLVARLKSSYDSIENEKTNLFIGMEKEAQEINRLTASLAKVNQAIKGQPANLTLEQEKKNTLLNERDKLLKELSNHIDMKVRYNKDGSADVFSAKGHALVLADRNFEVSLQEKQIDLGGGLQTTTRAILIDGVDLSSDFSKGSFGAKIEYQKRLEESMKRLNSFAISFASENNTIQVNGYDLIPDDTSTDPVTKHPSEPLFAYDGYTLPSNYDPANVQNDVNDKLNIKNLVVFIEDPKKIATSSKDNVPSNNDNAKAFYSLKDKKIASLDNKTFYDYYIDLVGDVANAKDFHTKMATDSRMLVDAVESKLQEISGVNMDEELMNLMQLQHAYQAAAKVINVTDELLQTVMGLVR